MSKISFECHSCSQGYKVDAGLGGKATKCRKCGAEMRVPRVELDSPKASGAPKTSATETAKIAPQAAQPQPVPKAGPTRVLSKDEMKRMMQGGSPTPVMAPPPPLAAPPLAAPPVANFPQRRVSSRSGGSSRRMPVAGAAANHPGGGQFDPNHSFPVRKKKNNNMVIGLSVGAIVVAIGVAVAAIMIVGSDNKESEDNNKQAKIAEVPDQPNPEAERRKKLDDDKAWLERNVTGFLANLSNTTDYGQLWLRYQTLKEKTDLSAELANERKVNLDKLAKYLRDSSNTRADNQYLELHYTVSTALKNDGYEAFAKDIASYIMNHNAFTLPAGGSSADQFKELAAMAGWQKIPSPLDDPRFQKDYLDHFPAYSDITRIEKELDSQYNLKGYCPPERLVDLDKALNVLLENIKEIEAQQAKDGFAEYALRAFVQFKSKYSKLYEKKITPGSTWQYKYAKPFIYFVEVPPGEVLDNVVEGMKLKERILLDLVEFFNENYRDRWKLERQYPFSEPNAEERSKWPLEIVVLSSEAAYQSYQVATSGGVSPGARAHYEPNNYRVITWDDKAADTNPEAEWFNKSVLIHESWHFLSGTHMDSRFDKQWLYKPNPRDPNGQYVNYPGYLSILIQEGLTDHVAGFEEKDGKFEFQHVNHLRMKSVQEVTKSITESWKRATQTAEKNGDEFRGRRKWEEGKWASVYDVRSMVQVLMYFFTGGIVRNHLVNDLGIRDMNVGRFSNSNNATVMIYALGSSFAHFCDNYEGGKYKDMFDEWCRRDYKGVTDKYAMTPMEAQEKEWKENPGLLEFMKVFNIDSYDSPRWDELTDQWLAYAMKVEVKDVGKATDAPETDDKPKPDNTSGSFKAIADRYQRFIDDPALWYGPEGEKLRAELESDPFALPLVEEMLEIERNATPARFLRALAAFDSSAFDRLNDAFWRAIESVPSEMRKQTAPKVSTDAAFRDGEAPVGAASTAAGSRFATLRNEDE